MARAEHSGHAHATSCIATSFVIRLLAGTGHAPVSSDGCGSGVPGGHVLGQALGDLELGSASGIADLAFRWATPWMARGCGAVALRWRTAVDRQAFGAALERHTAICPGRLRQPLGAQWSRRIPKQTRAVHGSRHLWIAGT